MNCSINDIANHLGLSRNTVSKALNGKSGVSKETRKMILETAVSMKYRQFLLSGEIEEKHSGEIILLTKSTAQPEFWLSVMEGIKKEIQNTGLTLAMSIVSEEEISSCHIPSILYQSDVRGIVLVEVCNAEMCRKLLSLNIPIVSVDYPQHAEDVLSRMDVVTMENKDNVKALVKKLYASGRRHFSFAGNLTSDNTSQGVMDRYEAFREALAECSLQEEDKYSLTTFPQDDFINIFAISKKILAFDSCPDVYICCNDWVAIHLLQALSALGKKVPKDVAVAGFDDVVQATSLIPSLTTIRTPKELLGMETVHCLLSKINNPERSSLKITATTSLVIRETTGEIK